MKLAFDSDPASIFLFKLQFRKAEPLPVTSAGSGLCCKREKELNDVTWWCKDMRNAERGQRKMVIMELKQKGTRYSLHDMLIKAM